MRVTIKFSAARVLHCTTTLSFALCAWAFLSGCAQRDPHSQRPATLQLRLVQPPELSEEFKFVTASFESGNPRLPDGLPIKIQLDPHAPLEAASAIADGSLKTHAWLASSLSLVNYTNAHLSNLGPQQVECQQLFASPVVVAVAESAKHFFNPLGQKFSWKEFFDPRLDLEAAARTRTVFFHGMPMRSISGFAALMQLAYLSAFKVPEVLDLETLKADASFKRLARYEDFVSSYFSSDASMLDRVSRADGTRPVFALVTEQLLAQYNLTHKDPAARLTALYPAEGSYWENFNLCLSDADWVSPAHRAAYKKYSALLASERAQLYFKERGFRPANNIPANLEVLSTHNGVETTLPTNSFLPVPGEVVAYLKEKWGALARPSANLLVIDTSGSTDDYLQKAIEVVRNWAATQSKRDQNGLLTFNADLSLRQPLGTGPVAYIKALNGLRSTGGSAIYDAIKRSLDMMTDAQLDSFRKHVLLLTDGDDKNSQISLELLSDLVKQKSGSEQINLSIVAVQRPDVNLSDLRRIAKDAHGTFREVSPADVAQALSDVFRQIE